MNIQIKNRPMYDPGYTPIGVYKRAYEQGADIPLCIAAQRDKDVSTLKIALRGTDAEDLAFAERMAKTLLWQKGGYRLMICGPKAVYEHIKAVFCKEGARAFDVEMMEKVYQTPFEVIYKAYEARPMPSEKVRAIGRHLDGCRIGFDAGGSDRKVSAVINGETVYSEEVVWNPKTNTDPKYHFQGIMDALETAAKHLPKVDAIGVSSAGIYIDNKTAVASLFRAVPKEAFDREVRDIYLRAAVKMGGVPLQVCNDGDVTALAGSMVFEKNALLGLAMGTSEAAGYVDKTGSLTEWLNELAFVPVDMNPEAMRDEWSGDIGCGVSYFSQDAVIKLAENAGFDLPDDTPAEKLKAVQNAASMQEITALQIFSDIGCYLGHTIAFYADIYDIENVLLLGRVMSGVGGEALYLTAKRVLTEEYPELAIDLLLPNNHFRRIGQSIAAASLPEIGGETYGL